MNPLLTTLISFLTNLISFPDASHQFPVNAPQMSENSPDGDVMSRAEQEALGYYNVEKILDHEFRQGWKFLVQWENFPVSAATWEPISAFVHPNGSVNKVFKEYCEEHNLPEILKKALSAP